ncbi:FAD-dependent tricarballylate dehydrogenase TcuA [Faunimonas sp. B44]|uniref:FAD-dependent tricarballylate dehydrogenase TcuA n=1 Tax=Faunimonas sp. B44 TaxID=3461493 RepID=UPI004044B7A2
MTAAQDFGSADVIVVGGGNAACCAALSAREAGARVLMLEAAPEELSGGNSRFTGGGYRFAFNGIDDLAELMPDLSESERETLDFGSYPEAQFFDDMGRTTNYRTDPDLCEILVTKSFETMGWLRRKGVRFEPSFGHTFKVGGKLKFWGGLACVVSGGGPGLVEAEYKACAEAGIPIVFDTSATDLLLDPDRRVRGVRAVSRGRTVEIAADAVVLACGGFQASAEMRARYLGPGWDVAKVRGTRFNTGGGIRMALEAGAMSYGHYSGCHSVGWELNAPPFGDLAVGDQFQKHSYPFGIMVNARGERFVDEGADIRIYTYAKYGSVILKQPDMFAWQIFDAKTIPLLRGEYRIRQVTKVTANSLEELVGKLEGVDPEACLREIEAFNRAATSDRPFDPTVKDGLRTTGLAIPKSNWARPIDTPPFEAYAVTCGVTFTFGGVKISRAAEVEDVAGRPMPGLYAAGEMVGGLFYHNYPAGSGLLSGSVFGRIAGASAAAHARAATGATAAA